MGFLDEAKGRLEGVWETTKDVAGNATEWVKDVAIEIGEVAEGGAPEAEVIEDPVALMEGLLQETGEIQTVDVEALDLGAFDVIRSEPRELPAEAARAATPGAEAPDVEASDPEASDADGLLEAEAPESPGSH